MKRTWTALLLGAALLRGQPVTQADLQAWLAGWQGRMRLQYWRISISVAHRADMPRDAVGSVRIRRGEKTAAINILDAAEVPNIPAERLRRYTELTVVHELVHVALAPVVPREREDGKEGRENERVQDISEMLLFGRVPACVSPEDFIGAEVVSLPYRPPNPARRDEVVGKLAAAFLDGRPSWKAAHDAECASLMKNFFAKSEWR
jgi:hypothetical protein